MGATTTFMLNDEVVETDAPRGRLVLDFVRERRLTGTKEGCKEGDCGACAILVGALDGGRPRYELMTACLVPLGEMAGKHVVTVEGLNLTRSRQAGRRLSVVQEEMVHHGGTQCGYCTPGFIVAMTWYVIVTEGADLSREGMREAISGNLCRCTGYNAIERAADAILATVKAKGPPEGDRLPALVEAELLPSYFASIGDRLAEMSPEMSPAPPPAAPTPPTPLFLAGGTDLYVQRGAEIPGAPVRLLTADDVAAQYPRIRGIREEGPVLSLGALTTFTEFAEHEAVRRLVPRIDRFLWLIASRPIRNRATLGGNIVNASPIGDMTNLLLALGATLVLAEGDDRRDVALRDLYRGYKQLDKRPGELLVEIRLARETAHTLTNFEKVSKRKALDIASVCSGARFEREAGVLTHAAISMGGVGPTPKLLTRTGIFLQGKRLSPAVVGEALSIAAGEATPIDDVRGSARYKRLLARQLLLAHFTELFDEIDPLAHMGPELAAAQ